MLVSSYHQPPGGHWGACGRPSRPQGPAQWVCQDSNTVGTGYLDPKLSNLKPYDTYGAGLTKYLDCRKKTDFKDGMLKV